jgi:hypothetical protein
MNYEDASDKVKRASIEGFGKRFRVHTDISSCFHSIYSHSIPWAVLGFDVAKSMMSSKCLGLHWSDKLDTYTRKSKRNETLGIAIGPASSSIIVELILGRIDTELTKMGFEFRRYIDDYVCNCETHEDAKLFIRVLGQELNRFKLNINLHKTKIVDLPEPISDDWVSELAGCLPTIYICEKYSRRKYLLPEVINYLDTAVRVNKRTPDGSVLKYAMKTIVHHIDEHSITEVLHYIINLAWHYPLLLPHLDILLSSDSVDPSNYGDSLNKIIVENAKNKRSDGMSWPLYYLKKYSIAVSNEAYAEVLKSEDCLAMVCLYSLGCMQQHIIEFAYGLLCKTDYEKDQYWLLLYELYRDGHFNNVYEDDKVFELLKKYDVTFLPVADKTSSLEDYCSYLNGPFHTFGMDPNDLSNSVEIELASYENWVGILKQEYSGFIPSPKSLKEALLPFHILSDKGSLEKWMPLISRMNQVLIKENYYDWSRNEHFLSVMDAVLNVQLKKINYPEKSYVFTKSYLMGKAVDYFRKIQ